MRLLSCAGFLGAVAATMAGCGIVQAGTFTHVATLDQPVAGILAADGSGNLYAETGLDQYQSSNDSVLLLKAASNYAVRRTLYAFSSTSEPVGYGVSGGVTLASGMILGVTDYGGSNTGGTVFNLGKLSSITPTVLSAFPAEEFAQSGLTAGPNNLYYGTTYSNHLFQIGPDPANPQYSVLHQFGGGNDGSQPTIGRLAEDAQGRLVGLTQGGGAFNNGTAAGTVFTLQQVSGVWQEQVVFSFSNAPGQLYPSRGSNVIEDAKGNLYACLTGGIYGFGGLIELQPTQNPNAPYFESTLVQFGVHSYDSYVYRSCAITRDPATGGIVGVTDAGGRQDDGTLFTLAPPGMPGDSGWTYKVVHNFAGTERDGINPAAAPIELNGAFYGSAEDVIWRYTP